MSAREFVYCMARLYGYPRREAADRTQAVLEEVGMADRAHRKLAGCSHGMRQRIKLAQALVHDPEVLLLDEPLNGVDPGGRRDINDLLKRLAQRGKTILVSSHILVEVEHLADEVIVIARGRIVASGTLSEIRALLADRPFTVAIEAGQPRQLAALLVGLPEVAAVDIWDQTLTIKTRNPSQFFTLFGDLVLEHELDVSRLEIVDAGAEAVFDYLQKV
jgi:ABC-2 type transport system ATP-binding protein